MYFCKICVCLQLPRIQNVLIRLLIMLKNKTNQKQHTFLCFCKKYLSCQILYLVFAVYVFVLINNTSKFDSSITEQIYKKGISCSLKALYLIYVPHSHNLCILKLVIP